MSEVVVLSRYEWKKSIGKAAKSLGVQAGAVALLAVGLRKRNRR